jgi:hypothetical protein
MSTWASLTNKTKQYTITTQLLTEQDYTISVGRVDTDSIDVLIGNELVGSITDSPLTFRVTAPSDSLTIRTYYNTIVDWVKLEKGNKATDWTQAPEDIDAKFNEQDAALADLTTISQTNTSLITQTNDAITSLVSQETHQTSLDGLKDELEGYVVGELDTRITNYSSEVDQRFDSITTTFTGVTTDVSNLSNELQTSLDEISTYIRFSIDGIELGELGNPIKLFIENDRIVFTQNDVEVAYIDNNRLYITDGQFLGSLRLGEFAFIPRENGNLSFGKVM